MITECCAYCIYRFDCEDYKEEDSENSVCNSYAEEAENEHTN